MIQFNNLKKVHKDYSNLSTHIDWQEQPKINNKFILNLEENKWHTKEADNILLNSLINWKINSPQNLNNISMSKLNLSNPLKNKWTLIFKWTNLLIKDGKKKIDSILDGQNYKEKRQGCKMHSMISSKRLNKLNSFKPQ